LLTIGDRKNNLPTHAGLLSNKTIADNAHTATSRSNEIRNALEQEKQSRWCGRAMTDGSIRQVFNCIREIWFGGSGQFLSLSPLHLRNPTAWSRRSDSCSVHAAVEQRETLVEWNRIVLLRRVYQRTRSSGPESEDAARQDEHSATPVATYRSVSEAD